jgi:hypothetical protein
MVASIIRIACLVCSTSFIARRNTLSAVRQSSSVDNIGFPSAWGTIVCAGVLPGALPPSCGWPQITRAMVVLTR